MEEALVSLLLADGGVSSLVSSRINWGRAPRGASQRPYVVLRRVSGIHDYHMAGPSGLVESRVQIECYGETYASAKSATRALQSVLSGYRGTVEGTHFQGIFIENEDDLSNEEDAGSVTNLYGVRFDITLWHD